MLCVDISNFTDDLTSENLEALKKAGVGHVIVQAIDPPAGFPAGKTRQQIQACLTAGFTVDAYVWLWFDLGISDIQHKLSLLDGLYVRRLWLDVEDQAAAHHSQVDCEAKVTAALTACDAYLTTGGRPTGLYSGGWFWRDPNYMANTTAFADRDLWDANYDDVADAAEGFVPYGGWAGVRVKQFRGSTSVGGIGGVDLNVLSLAEEEELMGTDFPDVPPNPIPSDCEGYRAAIERGVNRLQIELDRKTAAGKPATLRRTLIREISAELFSALSS